MNSACPYAVTTSDDEDSASIDSSILKEAKKSCPAFADSCPFAQATSAEQVKQTLTKIPSSHYKDNEYVQKALERIHSVAPTDSQFVIPGGCPVSKENIDDLSFTDAMERFSLVSVISKMIVEEEGDEMTSDSESSEPSPPPQSSRRSSLSEAFKNGTANAHEAAENVHFVKNFVKGEIDRGLYGDLVLSLYHVYKHLEAALDQHADAHFKTCHFPHELKRLETLEEDLDFWHGGIPTYVSPATQDYIDRLEKLQQTNPLLLLSHAYTRYLGDLSGGKVLQRVARRAMNLGKDGLAFYEFENIPSAKRFKDTYRQALDGLDLRDSQVNDLVHEANLAFLLNMRLFEELDVKANVKGASVRSLAECFHIAFKESDGNNAASECPFLKKENTSMKSAKVEGRCPWPFVFFHDPAQGMKDYQTWVVLGLGMAFMWNQLS